EWVVQFQDGGRMTYDFEPFNEDPVLWIAQGYILTTLDGTEYEFSARNPNTGISKLRRITNRNGRTITISSNGIFPENGPGIIIQRDGQGRIVKIIDLNQNAITYEYDSAGDLIALTDRTNFTTRFEYNND